jgi:hypothetical protein
VTVEYETHVALYQRLKNDERILAAGVNVYDAIPEGAAMPYISIDDWSMDRYHSKTFDGIEARATISVLSERSGKAEVLRLMSYVRAALKPRLELREGHSVDLQTVENARIIEVNDTDVVTTPIKHGVVIFVANIKEAEPNE